MDFVVFQVRRILNNNRTFVRLGQGLFRSSSIWLIVVLLTIRYVQDFWMVILCARVCVSLSNICRLSGRLQKVVMEWHRAHALFSSCWYEQVNTAGLSILSLQILLQKINFLRDRKIRKKTHQVETWRKSWIVQLLRTLSITLSLYIYWELLERPLKESKKFSIFIFIYTIELMYMTKIFFLQSCDPIQTLDS